MLTDFDVAICRDKAKMAEIVYLITYHLQYETTVGLLSIYLVHKESTHLYYCCMSVLVCWDLQLHHVIPIFLKGLYVKHIACFVTRNSSGFTIVHSDAFRWYIINLGRKRLSVQLMAPNGIVHPRLPESLSYLPTNPHQIQNLNVSRLVLQVSWPNPLKPGVNSRIKMLLGQRWQAMLQLHLSDQQVHFLRRCDLFQSIDGMAAWSRPMI